MRQYLSLLFLILTIVTPLFSIAEEIVQLQSNSLNQQLSDLIEQRVKKIPERNPSETDLYKLQELEKHFQQSNKAGEAYKITYEKIYQDIAVLCKDSTECIKDASTHFLEAIQQTLQKMRNMILFPKYYRKLGYRKRIESQKNAFLICNDCSDFKIREDIFYGSEQVYSAAYNEITKKDSRCIATILNKHFNLLESAQIPQICSLEENKDDFVCQTMNEEKRIRQNRIADLTALYDNKNVSDSESNSCLPPNFRTSWGINDMKNFLNETQDLQMCQPLEPGEEKQILPLQSYKHPYVIQRKQDGSYAVNLNMHFVAGTHYDGDIRPKLVNLHYKKKVKDCLNEANSKLLGPNEEKLNIIISSPTNNCETLKSKKIEIEIMSESHRSNSIQYSSDISCETIVHEILHIFGLADEYDEKELFEPGDPRITTSGIIEGIFQEIQYLIFGNYEDSAYNCRFVSEDSIMGNHWERWKNTVKSEEHTSLLSPRHFNFILYGRCQEKNQLFDKCTQQAYQHFIDNAACLETKKQCEEAYDDSN